MYVASYGYNGVPRASEAMLEECNANGERVFRGDSGEKEETSWDSVRPNHGRLRSILEPGNEDKLFFFKLEIMDLGSFCSYTKI